MTYEIAKFLHITGVVMLMGNITVTAIWKYFADRTQRPEVLSFAQKLVTYTDWSMTVWGVVLLMGGGYFMVFSANWPLTLHWLLASQILFVVAGLSGFFCLCLSKCDKHSWQGISLEMMWVMSTESFPAAGYSGDSSAPFHC